MTRSMMRAGSVALVALALLLPTSSGATEGAETDLPGHSEYGEHVVRCSRAMGFDGVHNPGMHQGFHGWSPDHVCMA